MDGPDDYYDGIERGPVKSVDEFVKDLKTVIRELADNYNQCVPVDTWYEPSALNSPSVQIGFGTFYALIWLFGVGGNSLVLTVIGYGATSDSKSKKRNKAFPVRSIFVASLASADLLVALASLPVTAVTGFTREWIFPSFLCHCIGFFQAFSIFQSSFTFTAIAIDRFLLICHGQRSVVTFDRARLAVLMMALVAAAIASPMAIFMNVVQLEPMCGKFCVETWPQTAEEESADVLADFDETQATHNSAALSRLTYGLFVTLLQLGLPTIVTSICYVKISRKLEQQQKLRKVTDKLMPDVEKRLSERRHRTNRMMACMVFAFTLLWLPLNAMNIMRDFGIFGKIFDQRKFNISYGFCHLVAMVSCVWNPLIYAWYNESIRAVVVAFCSGRRCAGNRSWTRLNQRRKR